jgi:hypothetical protein
LQHEKDRRKEHQVGDESRKNFLTAVGEQPTSDPASGDARRDECFEPRPQVAQVAPVAINAAYRSRDQRERARGVGDHGRHTKKQHRESDECSSSGYGIDQPRSARGGEKGYGFKPSHVEILTSSVHPCDANVRLVECTLCGECFEAVMKKMKIIHAVVEHLRGDFERRISASQRSRQEGNDAESKSEGKYDTRSTEENYLADGLARHALEAAEAAVVIEKMPLRDFQPEESVGIGALVEFHFSHGAEFFLIAPVGGGTEVVCDGRTIVVLTPESPLGGQLMGRRAGDHAGQGRIAGVF